MDVGAAALQLVRVAIEPVPVLMGRGLFTDARMFTGIPGQLAVIDSEGTLYVIALDSTAAELSEHLFGLDGASAVVLAQYQLFVSSGSGVPHQPVKRSWSVMELTDAGRGVLFAQSGSGRLMFAELPLREGQASTLFLLGSHHGEVRSLIINRAYAVSGGTDGCTKLWHLGDGRLLDTVEDPGRRAVTALTFVGPLLIAAGNDGGVVALLDISSERMCVVQRIAPPADCGEGPADCLAARFKPEQQAELATVHAPRSPDGGGVTGSQAETLLLLASSSGWLHVYRPPRRAVDHVRSKSSDDAAWQQQYSVAVRGRVHAEFSPDGDFLALRSDLDGGCVAVLDAASGHVRHAWHHHRHMRMAGRIAGLGFLSDRCRRDYMPDDLTPAAHVEVYVCPAALELPMRMQALIPLPRRRVNLDSWLTPDETARADHGPAASPLLVKAPHRQHLVAPPLPSPVASHSSSLYSRPAGAKDRAPVAERYQSLLPSTQPTLRSWQAGRIAATSSPLMDLASVLSPSNGGGSVGELYERAATALLRTDLATIGSRATPPPFGQSLLSAATQPPSPPLQRLPGDAATRLQARDSREQRPRHDQAERWARDMLGPADDFSAVGGAIVEDIVAGGPWRDDDSWWRDSAPQPTAVSPLGTTAAGSWRGSAPTAMSPRGTAAGSWRDVPVGSHADAGGGDEATRVDTEHAPHAAVSRPRYSSTAEAVAAADDADRRGGSTEQQPPPRAQERHSVHQDVAPWGGNEGDDGHDEDTEGVHAGGWSGGEDGESELMRTAFLGRRLEELRMGDALEGEPPGGVTNEAAENLDHAALHSQADTAPRPFVFRPLDFYNGHDRGHGDVERQAAQYAAVMARRERQAQGRGASAMPSASLAGTVAAADAASALPPSDHHQGGVGVSATGGAALQDRMPLAGGGTAVQHAVQHEGLSHSFSQQDGLDITLQGQGWAPEVAHDAGQDDGDVAEIVPGADSPVCEQSHRLWRPVRSPSSSASPHGAQDGTGRRSPAADGHRPSRWDDQRGHGSDTAEAHAGQRTWERRQDPAQGATVPDDTALHAAHRSQEAEQRVGGGDSARPSVAATGREDLDACRSEDGGSEDCGGGQQQTADSMHGLRQERSTGDAAAAPGAMDTAGDEVFSEGGDGASAGDALDYSVLHAAKVSPPEQEGAPLPARTGGAPPAARAPTRIPLHQRTPGGYRPGRFLRHLEARLKSRNQQSAVGTEAEADTAAAAAGAAVAALGASRQHTIGVPASSTSRAATSKAARGPGQRPPPTAPAAPSPPSHDHTDGGGSVLGATRSSAGGKSLGLGRASDHVLKTTAAPGGEDAREQQSPEGTGRLQQQQQYEPRQAGRRLWAQTPALDQVPSRTPPRAKSAAATATAGVADAGSTSGTGSELGGVSPARGGSLSHTAKRAATAGGTGVSRPSNSQALARLAQAGRTRGLRRLNYLTPVTPAAAMADDVATATDVTSRPAGRQASSGAVGGRSGVPPPRSSGGVRLRQDATVRQAEPASVSDGGRDVLPVPPDQYAEAAGRFRTPAVDARSHGAHPAAVSPTMYSVGMDSPLLDYPEGDASPHQTQDSPGRQQQAAAEFAFDHHPGVQAVVEHSGHGRASLQHASLNSSTFLMKKAQALIQQHNSPPKLSAARRDHARAVAATIATSVPPSAKLYHDLPAGADCPPPQPRVAKQLDAQWVSSRTAAKPDMSALWSAQDQLQGVAYTPGVELTCLWTPQQLAALCLDQRI